MGHERLGTLPKTKPWRAIATALAEGARDAENTRAVIRSTLQQARGRFLSLASEEPALTAVRFLAGLSRGASTTNTTSREWDSIEITRELRRALSVAESNPEHIELLYRAFSRGLVRWARHNSSGQQALFGRQSTDLWNAAAGGGGFSELAQYAFSSLTELYVNYFLDRTASQSLGNVDDSEAFRLRVALQAEDAARNAFETAKIAQSFAAGWFHKYCQGDGPTNQNVRAFLKKALSKINEELRREQGPV